MTEDLGKLLEKLRGKMTLRDAAKKSGLSHSYIRDLELNKNRKTNAPIRPSLDTLKSLAIAYNYPYHKLLKQTGMFDDDVPNEVNEEMGEYITEDELDRVLKSYTGYDREKAAKILKAAFPEKEDTN
jgi:transcriptional regulator with XRE-family HTH domain